MSAFRFLGPTIQISVEFFPLDDYFATPRFLRDLAGRDRVGDCALSETGVFSGLVKVHVVP